MRFSHVLQFHTCSDTHSSKDQVSVRPKKSFPQWFSKVSNSSSFILQPSLTYKPQNCSIKKIQFIENQGVNFCNQVTTASLLFDVGKKNPIFREKKKSCALFTLPRSMRWEPGVARKRCGRLMGRGGILAVPKQQQETYPAHPQWKTSNHKSPKNCDRFSTHVVRTRLKMWNKETLLRHVAPFS